ncbi:MAG: 50S ribosomal protein L25 [Planctomycetaceae bacterium]|nr:50S ribosomal protein L25 [Planctomycetaceae bacterium]
MSTTEKLNVTKRAATGKLNNRRLRTTGRLPAVLYGHKEEPVNLEIAADELRAVLRHGTHVVDLQGGAKGQALLQNIQWDVFQQHLLHVDLLRVDATERITVEVPIHTKGEAPGVLAGGLLEHVLHAIEIETSPANIPEALHVNINQLEIGGTIRVEDIIDMPEGASATIEPIRVVLNCSQPTAEPEPEEEAAVSSSVEPEVIGEKDEEESSEG